MATINLNKSFIEGVMKNRMLIFCILLTGSLLSQNGKEKTITYYESVKPRWIDPVYGDQDIYGARVLSLIFTPIYDIDINTTLKPKLLVNPPVVSGSEVVFKLKPGMKWHDGENITNNDLIETYSMLVNEQEFVRNNLLNEFINFREDGDNIIATLRDGEKYQPYFLQFNIMPAHKFPLGRVDRNSEFSTKTPIGNGPFRIEENKTDKIIFRRFDDYKAVTPQLTNIEKIILKVQRDRANWGRQMQSGIVDILPVVPIRQFSYLKDLENVGLQEHPSYGIEMIGYNCKNPLLQEKFIRKIFYYAYDRQQGINAQLSANGNIATGPYPVGTIFFPATLEPYPFNPELAKKELEKHCEMGRDGVWVYHGKRLSFQLIGSSGNSVFTDESNEFVQAMAGIGIEILPPKAYDWGNLQMHYQNGDFDLIWINFRLNESLSIEDLYRSDGKLNYFGYSNTRADALFDEMRATEDIYYKKTAAYKLHEELHNDPPALFLWTEKLYTAYNKRIKHFKSHPIEFFYLVNEWKLED